MKVALIYGSESGKTKFEAEMVYLKISKYY